MILNLKLKISLPKIVKATKIIITMFRFIIRLPAIKLKGINATSMIKIFVIKSDLKGPNT